jgi:uncharacterized protein involved in exopolysaccharide biosynthesis
LNAPNTSYLSAPYPDYLGTLAQQRWFIFVFVLSAAATALAMTYVYSEKYESYTAISYRTQEVTRFKAQQSEAMGSPAPQAPFKVIGQSLQEVLKSDAVLRKVVQTLRLDEKSEPSYEGPWYNVWYQKARDWAREHGGRAWSMLKYGRVLDENPTDAAVKDLRANVKVTNRDSYIFQLQVRDRYPERAAQIADHMAQVLATWLLDLDRQPGHARVDQLRGLLGDKHRQMAQRRREIETLLIENRVASVPLETERLTENLAALQLEALRLESEIARARARHSSVQSKLSVKQRVLGRPGASAEPAEFIQPDDFKKLASQSVFDDVDLKSLLAKQASLHAAIEALGARLRRLPGIQSRLDTLKLSLSSTEREFNLLNDGYQEAALRATSPVSEVRVLHPALVPSVPVAPIKVYHVLLAGGLGLLFAIGLVYFLDFLNIRILFASRGVKARRLATDATVEPPLRESKEVKEHA